MESLARMNTQKARLATLKQTAYQVRNRGEELLKFVDYFCDLNVKKLPWTKENKKAPYEFMRTCVFETEFFKMKKNLITPQTAFISDKTFDKMRKEDDAKMFSKINADLNKRLDK